MQKAFIFDFDGTIAETIPLTLDAFFAAYRKLSVPEPSLEVVKSEFGAEERGILRALNPEIESELYRAYLEEYERLLKERGQRPFDGIEELLQNLRSRGARVSLVTGKGAETAAISVRVMGLEKYFDFVESGGLYGSVKPEKMRKILDNYKIPPSSAFYIGDSPRDVLDSREVGVFPMAAAWSGIVSAEQFSQVMPVDIFYTVGEAAKFALERLSE